MALTLSIILVYFGFYIFIVYISLSIGAQLTFITAMRIGLYWCLANWPYGNMY